MSTILVLSSYVLLLPHAIVLRAFVTAYFCLRGFVLRAFVGSPFIDFIQLVCTIPMVGDRYMYTVQVTQSNFIFWNDAPL